MQAHIFWRLLPEPGLEHLRLIEDETGTTADGLVLGVDDGSSFRLLYKLRAGSDWVVRWCQLRCLPSGGGDSSSLVLRSDGAGHWTDATGNPFTELDGCLDLDIRVTPFTNSLPIRRLALAPGASDELTVGYVSVPELSVRLVRQRYTCLSRTDAGGVYRYEGLDSGFHADLTVDARGLVTDYPHIWTRVWAHVT